jgi:hypothetical protein
MLSEEQIKQMRDEAKTSIDYQLAMTNTTYRC